MTQLEGLYSLCVSTGYLSGMRPRRLGAERGGARGGGAAAKPQARPNQEPESKPEPDRARVPESESKEEPDLLWTRESGSPRASPIGFGPRPRSPSPRGSPVFFFNSNPRARVHGRGGVRSRCWTWESDGRWTQEPGVRVQKKWALCASLAQAPSAKLDPPPAGHTQYPAPPSSPPPAPRGRTVVNTAAPGPSDCPAGRGRGPPWLAARGSRLAAVIHRRPETGGRRWPGHGPRICFYSLSHISIHHALTYRHATRHLLPAA
jgi:hypothetical protein